MKTHVTLCLQAWNATCPYSTNPNADITRTLFDACRAEGLGISCYFSKADFHNEDYRENLGIGHYTDRWPTYKNGEQPEKWARFKEFTKNQILELVRDYGPIDVLWLDGAWLFPWMGPFDFRMDGIAEEAWKIKPDLIDVDRGRRTST